jgi:hypothetical protein
MKIYLARIGKIILPTLQGEEPRAICTGQAAQVCDATPRFSLDGYRPEWVDSRDESPTTGGTHE